MRGEQDLHSTTSAKAGGSHLGALMVTWGTGKATEVETLLPTNKGTSAALGITHLLPARYESWHQTPLKPSCPSQGLQTGTQAWKLTEIQDAAQGQGHQNRNDAETQESLKNYNLVGCVSSFFFGLA